MMRHLLDQSLEDLQAWMAEHGQPAYRARQIRRWLFEKRAAGLDEMTDLPRALREQLAADFNVFSARIADHRKADDRSEKLLLELADNQRIECVLLRDDRGHCNMCISTQVGCGMKCRFCATGIDGVVRNLTTGEIVEEMLQLQRLLGPEERLSHIVVMGMGEPLANLDRLMPALALATSPDGLGISVRRVTISTVGIPLGIRRLAEQNCPYHLAISLHAPDDELRNQLVPTNRNIGIAAILAAADEYFDKTGRRVMFEYILLADVNDRPTDAARLVALLRGRPTLVNLIPYNPVSGLPFRRPTAEATAGFAEALTNGGLEVAVRHRKGNRINAACGQLRRIKKA